MITIQTKAKKETAEQLERQDQLIIGLKNQIVWLESKMREIGNKVDRQAEHARRMPY